MSSFEQELELDDKIQEEEETEDEEKD